MQSRAKSQIGVKLSGLIPARFVKCKFHLALNHCSCVYANAHTLLVSTGLHIDWLDLFLIEQGNHFLNLILSFIDH